MRHLIVLAVIIGAPVAVLWYWASALGGLQ